MSTKYTLYIDESGEAGISKVRGEGAKGASPYMVLGAALVPESHQCSIAIQMEEIASHFKKSYLHCNELNHHQKIFYSRRMAKEKFLAFGVISFKKTLGSYSSKINKSSDFFYNKCSQYLFERVGGFLEEKEIDSDSVKVVFESGNFDYSSLRNFIAACQRNPIHRNAKFLKRISVDKISSKSKSDDSLLQLADLIAHAIYKCVDKNERNYHIPEPRYLLELGKKFYRSENGGIEGYGLKGVHNMNNLSIDADILAAIRSI